MCQKTCVPVTLQALRSWNAAAAHSPLRPPTSPVWLACKHASVKVKSVPSEGSERRRVPGKSQIFQTSSGSLRKRHFHAGGMLSSEVELVFFLVSIQTSSPADSIRPMQWPLACWRRERQTNKEDELREKSDDG